MTIIHGKWNKTKESKNTQFFIRLFALLGLESNLNTYTDYNRIKGSFD